MRHTCVCVLLLHAVAAAMAPLPWGKKPCRDYLKDMRAQTPVVLDDGLVECHPLRHLRWTACVSEEEDAASPLPAQLHSGTPEVNARNSACHAAAAVGVDWTNVLRNAMAYRDGAPVPVVDCTNDWRVADAASLEVVADVDEALASDARAARVPFSSALVLPSNRGGRFPFGPLLGRSSRARGPRSGTPSPP